MGGLFGGGGQTQPAYYTSNQTPQSAGSYIPTAQPQADASLQQLMSVLGGQSNALTSAANYYQPGLQSGAVQQQQMGLGNSAYNTGAGDLSSLQNLLNFYMSGIQGQGQAGQQAQLALGQSLGPAASNLMGASGQLLNQAFDPNQALYTQLANQTQQQVAASNAMSGLSGTPYGANLGNQAMTNLGINWNAQQQANEAAGLNAAASGYGQGANLGATGAGLINQSGMTPFQDVLSAYSGALSPQGAATSLAGQGTSMLNQSGLTGMQDLASLYGAASPAQTQLENLLQSYLGLGQSASQTAGALGAQGFNQNQTGFGNILGAAGLGSNLLFGSGGLSGGLGLGTGGLIGSAPSAAYSALDSTTQDFTGGGGSGLLGLLGLGLGFL